MTMTPENPIYTIGHSTHPIDHFIGLLQAHSISAVADVRSQPYSRFNPQYNREELASSLHAAGIDYVYVGKELGARSDDPTCYEDGRVQFSRLANTDIFQSGIERVLMGSKKHLIALMCAEKEPLDCHRTLLVSRALEAKGVPIRHILADGGIEEQADTMLRLLDMTGLPRDDLFLGLEDLIAEACRRREARIAFVDDVQPKPSHGAQG